MTTTEKVLRWICTGGIFLFPFIPLYVANSNFFPYITGKNFAFRVFVEIITGSYLALALIVPQYRPRRSWILGALALFVAIIALADLQGAYPFKSFWSNFERMDGWVTIAHVLCYTVVVSVMMNSEMLWRRLFQTSLVVSLVACLLGMRQVLGYSALGEGGASGLTARIDATFGNPIYLACYMLFHIFIAALLWSQAWTERGPGKRTALSWLYGSVIVFDTIALFFTGTRGTILGLVGGIFVSALLIVILARNSRTAWRGAVVSVIGILLLVGVFYGLRNQPWVHKIGFLDRLATISTEDNTVKARFLNWQIAWHGVQERPLLGWGQENYALVFDKYYDPRMYAQEPWFDRVHNIVFDWLVAGGFLGLISYLLIFVATLFVLWRSGAFTIAERSIMTGLLVGYFFHNFFVFDNITSYILFGTVLGYIVWRNSAARSSPLLVAREIAPTSALPYVAIVAGIVVVAAVWGINQKAYAANHLIIKALSQQQGGIQQNKKYFEEAIALGSYGTQEAREQFIQITTQIASISAISTADKQAFLNASVNQMLLQKQASPLDARFPLFVGVVADAYGDYATAERELKNAHDLSPQKQSILYEMALNKQAQGKNDEALALFKQAFELEKNNKQARLFYAAAAITFNQQPLADELLAPLVPSGAAADSRILAAYASRKAYAKLIPIWSAKVSAEPTDSQGYLTLAAIYYAAGNRSKAIEVLNALKTAIPSTQEQADTLIAQVQNGTAQLGQ